MADSPTLHRRDLLKVGAFGAAALAVPGHGCCRRPPSPQIAASRLPAPYTVPSPSRRCRSGQGRPGDPHRVPRADPAGLHGPGAAAGVDTRCGATTARRPARPSRRGPAGRRWCARSTNCPRCTRPWATRRGRRPTCTACPRSRSTTGTPPTSPCPGSTRTTSTRTAARPGRSGTTTTACTTRAENVYMGLAALYVLTDRSRPRCPSRTAGTTSRWSSATSCSPPTARSVGRPRALRVYGDVVTVNGRPWPVMDVEQRLYRFRVLKRLDLARLPAAAEQRPALPGHRHRRRPDAGPQTVTELKIAWPSGTRSSSTSPASGPASRSAGQRRGEERPRLRPHREGHALPGVRAGHQHRRQHRPRGAEPGRPGDGPDTGDGRRHPPAAAASGTRACGRSAG